MTTIDNAAILTAIRELSDRFERRMDQFDTRLRAVESGQAALAGEFRELKGYVQAAIEQMGHRVTDVNARIPVTLSYAPPHWFCSFDHFYKA